MDGFRVLIVDDDPIFRSLAAAKLVRYATQISEADDGTAGWAVLARDHFDLVVADLEMPGMSGIDLIRCVRGHPRLQQLPIIVVSSRDPAEAIVEALDSGASAYLTKPVNWATFQSHVDFIARLKAAADRGRELEAIAKSALVSLQEINCSLTGELSSCANEIAGIAEAALAKQASNPAALAQALRVVLDHARRAESGVSTLVSTISLQSVADRLDVPAQVRPKVATRP